jgi:predicted metalloenzyme YecM
MQAGYEYKSGSLGFFAVTEGIKPDQAYSNSLVDFVEKNDLSATLHSFDGNILEMNVIMGNDKHHVSCRLIGLRVTEQVANVRRRKLRKEAEKKGRTPSQNHLALCDWTLFVTNAPAEILPVNIVHSLYRLRWQIELVFKQLKSVLRIHSSNTTKVYRLKCEIYGKLIMAVLIHGIHSSVNSNMWLTKKREVSFDKLYKRIQERAFSLLQNILITVYTAVKQFLQEINRLAIACIKTRQPSRKTTLELLEDIHALSLP